MVNPIHKERAIGGCEQESYFQILLLVPGFSTEHVQISGLCVGLTQCDPMYYCQPFAPQVMDKC